MSFTPNSVHLNKICNISNKLPTSIVNSVKENAEENNLLKLPEIKKEIDTNESGLSNKYQNGNPLMEVRQDGKGFKYSCTICYDEFPSINEIDTHINSHFEADVLNDYLLNIVRTKNLETVNNGSLQRNSNTYINFGDSPIKVESGDNCNQYSNTRSKDLSHTILDLKENIVFTCILCNFSASNQDRLDIHLKLHSQNSLFTNLTVPKNEIDISAAVYQCSYCKFSTQFQIDFQKHSEVHSLNLSNDILQNVNIQKYVCIYCSRDFQSNSGLQSHIRFQKCSSKLTCFNCNYQTDYKPQLVRHINIHNKAKVLPLITKDSIQKCSAKLKCFICNYQADFKLQLAHHISTHNKTRLIPLIAKDSIEKCSIKLICMLCNYQTHFKLVLMLHMKTHNKLRSPPLMAKHPINIQPSFNERKPVSQHINDLDKKFRSNARLLASIEGPGNEQIKSNKQKPFLHDSNDRFTYDSIKSLYKCMDCNFTNIRKLDVMTHYKEMHSSKHICEYCKKEFNSTSLFIVHSTIIYSMHVAEFKCASCFFSCNCKELMAEHAETHQKKSINLQKSKIAIMQIRQQKLNKSSQNRELITIQADQKLNIRSQNNSMSSSIDQNSSDDFIGNNIISDNELQLDEMNITVNFEDGVLQNNSNRSINELNNSIKEVENIKINSPEVILGDVLLSNPEGKTNDEINDLNVDEHKNMKEQMHNAMNSSSVLSVDIETNNPEIDFVEVENIELNNLGLNLDVLQNNINEEINKLDVGKLQNVSEEYVNKKSDHSSIVSFLDVNKDNLLMSELNNFKYFAVIEGNRLCPLENGIVEESTTHTEIESNSAVVDPLYVDAVNDSMGNESPIEFSNDLEDPTYTDNESPVELLNESKIELSDSKSDSSHYRSSGTYDCSKCSYTTFEAKYLEKHFKKIHYKLTCVICNKMFSSARCLSLHMKNNIHENVLSGKVSDISEPESKSNKTILSKIIPTKPVLILPKGVRNKSPDSLNSVLDVSHSNDTNNIISYKSSRITRSVASTSSVDTFQFATESSGSESDSSYDLSSDGHACNKCNFITTTKKLLQKHIRTRHSKRNLSTKAFNISRSANKLKLNKAAFSCETCKKNFLNKAAMVSHSKSHSSNKGYSSLNSVLNTAKNSTTSSNNVSKIGKYTASNSLQCCLCKYNSTNKNELILHIKNCMLKVAMNLQLLYTNHLSKSSNSSISAPGTIISTESKSNSSLLEQLLRNTKVNQNITLKNTVANSDPIIIDSDDETSIEKSPVLQNSTMTKSVTDLSNLPLANNTIQLNQQTDAQIENNQTSSSLMVIDISDDPDNSEIPKITKSRNSKCPVVTNSRNEKYMCTLCNIMLASCDKLYLHMQNHKVKTEGNHEIDISISHLTESDVEFVGSLRSTKVDINIQTINCAKPMAPCKETKISTTDYKRNHSFGKMESQLKCNHCTMTFVSKDYLLSHISTIHSDTEKLSNLSQTVGINSSPTLNNSIQVEQTYTCTVCRNKIPVTVFEAHVKSHLNDFVDKIKTSLEFKKVVENKLCKAMTSESDCMPNTQIKGKLFVENKSQEIQNLDTDSNSTTKASTFGTPSHNEYTTSQSDILETSIENSLLIHRKVDSRNCQEDVSQPTTLLSNDKQHTTDLVHNIAESTLIISNENIGTKSNCNNREIEMFPTVNGYDSEGNYSGSSLVEVRNNLSVLNTIDSVAEKLSITSQADSTKLSLNDISVKPIFTCPFCSNNIFIDMVETHMKTHCDDFLYKTKSNLEIEKVMKDTLPNDGLPENEGLQKIEIGGEKSFVQNEFEDISSKATFQSIDDHGTNDKLNEFDKVLFNGNIISQSNIYLNIPTIVNSSPTRRKVGSGKILLEDKSEPVKSTDDVHNIGESDLIISKKNSIGERNICSNQVAQNEIVSNICSDADNKRDGVFTSEVENNQSHLSTVHGDLEKPTTNLSRTDSFKPLSGGSTSIKRDLPGQPTYTCTFCNNKIPVDIIEYHIKCHFDDFVDKIKINSETQKGGQEKLCKDKHSENELLVNNEKLFLKTKYENASNKNFIIGSKTNSTANNFKTPTSNEPASDFVIKSQISTTHSKNNINEPTDLLSKNYNVETKCSKSCHLEEVALTAAKGTDPIVILSESEDDCDVLTGNIKNNSTTNINIKIENKDVKEDLHDINLNPQLIIHPYKCDECQATFVNSQSLFGHKRISHPKYICIACNQKFLYTYTLEAHMYVYHKYTFFKLCNECNFYAICEDKYKQHIELHESKLEVLDQSNGGSLIQQTDEINPDKFKLYISPTALHIDNSFNQALSQESKEENTSFLCSKCSLMLTSNKGLLIHDRLVHAREKQYFCKICRTEFAIYRDLKLHMEKTHNSKIYKSHKYKFQTKEKEEFILHKKLRAKTNSKFIGYTRETACVDKRTSNFKKKFKECLNVKQTYDMLNVFPCNKCKFISSTNENLLRHIKKYHYQEKHICETCNNKFPTIQGLRLHMKSHFYSCIACKYFTKDKQKLDKHMEDIHLNSRHETRTVSHRSMCKNIKVDINSIEELIAPNIIYKSMLDTTLRITRSKRNMVGSPTSKHSQPLQITKQSKLNKIKQNKSNNVKHSKSNKIIYKFPKKNQKSEKDAETSSDDYSLNKIEKLNECEIIKESNSTDQTKRLLIPDRNITCNGFIEDSVPLSQIKNSLKEDMYFMGQSTETANENVQENTDKVLLSNTKTNTFKKIVNKFEQTNKTKRFQSHRSLYDMTKRNTSSKHIHSKLYSCKHCTFSTPSTIKYRLHNRLHMEKFLRACVKCSFKTENKIDIQNHFNIHSETMTFLCNLCKYSTLYRYKLISHIFAHTGEKPYSCKLCSFRVSSKRLLYFHLYAHIILKKRYRCKYCNYHTKQRKMLFNHLKLCVQISNLKN